MCDPVFFRHMAPPMSGPRVLSSGKDTSCSSPGIILSRARYFFFIYTVDRHDPSTPLDTRFDYLSLIERGDEERGRVEESLGYDSSPYPSSRGSRANNVFVKITRKSGNRRVIVNSFLPARTMIDRDTG